MSIEQITAFYDGRCGLCHRAVVFLLTRDRGERLYFAPIQSETYRTFAQSRGISLTPRSILVYHETEQRLLSEAAAVFYLLRYCGRFWRGIVAVCDMLPMKIWNEVYRMIAKVRHRLFAEPKGLIPELPPELMRRVLRD